MQILAVQVRTLYVQGGLRKWLSRRGYPSKKWLFIHCWLAKYENNWDMHRHAAYHNKH